MVKTHKSRILSCILAVLMAFALVLSIGCGGDGDSAIIDEIGGVSETYKGTVSEEAYDSQEDAAQAFLDNEIAGDKDLKIESSESIGVLTDSEVEALELPEELAKDIVEVEKLEVEYSEQGDDFASLFAASTTSNKKVIVYIIKYSDVWKYYSPMPEIGTTITKSYYDSVFNAESFKNCTFESTISQSSEISMSAMGQSENYTLDLEMRQFVKYTENAIYLKNETITESDMPGMEGELDDIMGEAANFEAYIEQTEDGIICYVKLADEDWIEADLRTIGFYSLDDIKPFADQYLDYTYFTKTDYGFEVSEENAKAYVDQTVNMAFGSMSDDVDMDMVARYFVSNGVLSGMRQDLTMNMDISNSYISMTMDLEQVAKSTVTDYGTTVVERPEM